MVKHTKKHCWLLPTSCLSVFNIFSDWCIKGMKYQIILLNKENGNSLGIMVIRNTKKRNFEMLLEYKKSQNLQYEFASTNDRSLQNIK